ncbi:MAG: Asp-tRNA(Asn)/Glu-tRNA(Gln) amidotransferase subunit GatB [Nanoarchaeota archaeon]
MIGKIGLEIHTYLTTREKLFCRCRASRERGTKPNSFVCPICTGQPGAKPMRPNADAVVKAVKIGLLLECKINNVCPWMRKHYDWPDLPKGYQTTLSGAHAVPLGIDGKFLGIRIESMHLEEDPAAWDPNTGKLDYNRSGLPLVEIVTAPDFKTAQEVYDWVRKLVHALSYLKAVDSNAGIKADVNVNLVDERGAKKTERVEVKNVNSVENMRAAIEHEIERQMREGGVRETRRFDEVKGKTIRMRGKEQAWDYRFIADPDLVVLQISKDNVLKLQKELPELPNVKLERLIKKYKISSTDAAVLAKNIDIALFFEKVAGRIDGSFALPWVNVELLRVLNWNKKSLDEVSISVEHFVKLLEMVKNRKITELQAKQILNKFVPASFDPSKVDGKISDIKELEPFVLKVIKENAKVVADYKSGDAKALNFLLGEVMKATERRADFAVARRLLENILK